MPATSSVAGITLQKGVPTMCHAHDEFSTEGEAQPYGWSISHSYSIACSNLNSDGTCRLFVTGNCCLRDIGQDFSQTRTDNRLERFTTGPEFHALRDLLQRAVQEL